MKKRFGDLTKTGRQRIETRYHKMNPHELDQALSRASRHVPTTIRLPAQLVETLRKVAESEGEPAYQDMVKRWIEERLQEETSATG